MKKILCFFFVLILFNSCSSGKKDSAYTKAMKNLKIGNYNVAAEMFEKIEDDQPFTREAKNGLIMASYSYYKGKQYEDSIRVIEYFIQSNPIDKNISYMYYLKGLDYYNRIKSSSKAIDIIENANFTFRYLIENYPSTEYAKDSLIKLKRVENYLSGNEMNIGDYYLERKNYVGAINHYTNILINYPNSEFVPQALYRLVEVNYFLNLKFESVKYYELLMKNYKNTIWAKHSMKIIKKYKDA